MDKKSIRKILLAIAHPVWTAGAFLVASLVFVRLPLEYFAGKSVLDWLSTSLGTLVLAACIYIVVAAFVVLPLLVHKINFAKLLERLGVSQWPQLRAFGKAALVWLLYMFSSLVAAAVVFMLHIPGVDMSQQQQIGFSGLSAWYEYVAAFFALVVIAPAFEELIFRGYLFGRLREVSGFWLSAVLTSLTFALLHFQVNVGVDVFILSLFLCYLREKYTSIWPGVLVHMLKNFLAFAVLFGLHM